VTKGRECGQRITPRDVVVVGIEQPVSVPTQTAEDAYGQEQKHGCERLEYKGQANKLPLVLEYPFHGVSQQQSDNDNLSEVGGDESHSDEKLDNHQPPRQEFLSDQPVLFTVQGMTAVEQMVELVVWVAEFVETKFPQTHVGEGAVCVRP